MNANQPENKPVKIGDEPEFQIPNGGAAAAILSAGIGCFCVSLFGVLGDAFPTLAHLLDFYAPTGPLSGVTTTAIAVWLIAWSILSRFWGGKTVPVGKINAIAFLLLGMGFLLSFPPFADFLQAK